MEVDFNVKNIVQVMLYSSPGIDMCVCMGWGVEQPDTDSSTLLSKLSLSPDTVKPIEQTCFGLLVQPQLLFSSLTFAASLVLSSYPDNITESFTRADLAFLPCGRPRPGCGHTVCIHVLCPHTFPRQTLGAFWRHP